MPSPKNPPRLIGALIVIAALLVGASQADARQFGDGHAMRRLGYGLHKLGHGLHRLGARARHHHHHHRG